MMGVYSELYIDFIENSCIALKNTGFFCDIVDELAFIKLQK